MSEYMTLSNSNELIRIAAERLVYVSSDGNYSDIYTCDRQRRTVTLQLGDIEKALERQIKQEEFVRIGKSLIVNMRHLSYINPSKQQIILSDNHTVRFDLTASKKALKQFKEYLEQNMETQ
ncbi:MAG: LytTR family transcriptional regulator DNA-binding domain-containing protein [Bacteroidales bacterium]|nr:LytTR family transcriptional regulator DNA-binding domain-containing protein [Bacteroidales bacterium]